MGLLTLGAILRQHGYRITYVDCQDRRHPQARQSADKHRFGRGPYLKTRIPKPPSLGDIPRHFCRYGILPQWFDRSLAQIPRPDLILVTSLMTYWYPGVQETIAHLRAVYPTVPIILGGIYATLCRSHAERHSGADVVIPGPAEDSILQIVGRILGSMARPQFDPRCLDSYPYPAFDLQHQVDYMPLLTSRGCPFACAYCAAKVLNPDLRKRSAPSVVEEIRYWHAAFGVDDFAFYDDALLINAEQHALPILEGGVRTGLKVRFHTPNALHIRAIDPQIARLMYRAGFETVRLGLETASVDAADRLDRKVTVTEFQNSVRCLRDAGFRRNQIGAYLLVGLPNQTLTEIEWSIRLVKQNRITPILAHYAPIPHTTLWPKAVAASRYPLEKDPIYTNNAIQPCQKTPFSWQKLSRLKALVSS